MVNLKSGAPVQYKEVPTHAAEDGGSSGDENTASNNLTETVTDPLTQNGDVEAPSSPIKEKSPTASQKAGSPPDNKASGSSRFFVSPAIVICDETGNNISSAEPLVEETNSDGDDSDRNKDNEPLASNDELSPFSNQMALYEDDLSERGKISQIINRISNYQAGIEPNISEQYSDKPKQAKLGTLLGVYLPTIQNIFGVLLFIRMTWIVGMAGALESLGIVIICCCTTMLTAISMSAIATNGVVPAGGSYFMISRSLGPEFGGAVGILFYLGTTVASSMYIIGSIEILVKYMAPQMSIFGDMDIQANAFNNYRVYGTCVLILLAIIVFIGVAFVSKFAALSLACVILSIFSIYIGIFVANPDSSLSICTLGDRLMSSKIVEVNGTFMCSKSPNISGGIFSTYCTVFNGTTDCRGDYLEDHQAKTIPGIPGLGSGVFVANLNNRYTRKDKIIGTDTSSVSQAEIIADITSSFMVLLAIYFPSCTGIMAGSNRSGDLADASRSIPTGTIAAIATTSFVYITSVIFFAGTVEGDLLRDKYGASINGGLLVAKLAWPNEWVILVGSFLSTLGAGLQSLTGAPRLLQAIGSDGVIPFLKVFSVTTKRGEPFRALIMTVLISEVGILIASLDDVAPIITMFFLMCYGFVNMACALQTLLRTPSWRPRFRFYHWVLSLIGMALCITLMFISSWYYALAAIALAFFIYKYIEYKGAEKEWGDGIRGLAMSAARYSLLRLQQGPPHTKNWRPQILVLMKMDENLQPKYPNMINFASQLKAGKGLTLINSVVEGDFKERYADAQAAKQTLNKLVESTGVKGFADLVISADITAGLCHMIQNAGLGGLRHNTVMIGWPYGWRHDHNAKSYRVFLEAVKNINAGQMALLAVKGINNFPPSSEKLKGTIDVWWIVHDGGMLMLLPFLLKQHKVWKNCRLRIFTVAQLEDNTIQMKKDLEIFMYHLRIEAEVEVVEMANYDISAYTYERTLMMEQRTEILKAMRGGGSKLSPQDILDNVHRSPAQVKIQLETVTEEGLPTGLNTESSTDEEKLEKHQYTFTPSSLKSDKKATSPPSPVNDLLSMKPPSSWFGRSSKTSPILELKDIKPDQRNVRRMHTAVRLNEVIIEKSHESQLVILNLPAPPKTEAGELNYMEFLEVLTEGLDRVLMVRGSGHEVITIYS
ncbi:solute carrier family 12 member 4-like isoform X2 [Mizuhopecten yessoensis]|uniref:solute carrier family 12 member 4-like isoform X2 n=1 Tax=Mizuhopecten yessoensis TaxID=6573 RepID=UPI000B45D1CF|nr:solute carrier family 12 member 4-like isoform X2 [Mizuhopecten yessoensis]